MVSAEEFEKQLYLKYGKVQWENMKRVYLKENIRQDIENYRDLVNEERELHKELKGVRETQGEGFLGEALIKSIRDEISENFNVQLDVLANISRCQKRIDNIDEMRSIILGE